jgi:hypothetical protein
MKIIGLLPVRDEAWVLPHSLACLSAFCDVVLVSDQHSGDASRDICRRFPKVVVLESAESQISTRARWTLLDAARGYDGNNLLWFTDADELVAPDAVRGFVDRRRDRLLPGTVVECSYVHLWTSPMRYRDANGPYAPYLKPIAFVDDRRMDYDRSRLRSIHEQRVPMTGAAATLTVDEVTVMHLQWLLPQRSQFRQAWYRCHEWMSGDRTAAEINARYAVTLPLARVPTVDVPAAWIDGITFPDFSVDAEPSWSERDVLAWFEARTPAFFEPLEIWHITSLEQAFRRHAGRRPRPDRSYRPSWPVRAAQFRRRAVAAARRRLPI